MAFHKVVVFWHWPQMHYLSPALSAEPGWVWVATAVPGNATKLSCSQRRLNLIHLCSSWGDELGHYCSSAGSLGLFTEHCGSAASNKSISRWKGRVVACLCSEPSHRELYGGHTHHTFCQTQTHHIGQSEVGEMGGGKRERLEAQLELSLPGVRRAKAVLGYQD